MTDKRMTEHKAEKDAAKVECNRARCNSPRLGKCFAWCKCHCHSTRNLPPGEER